MPLQLPEGDPRVTEIDEFRVQCIKLIDGYLDDTRVPAPIPLAKFKTLQDQTADGVMACVDRIYLWRERWWRGVGAIVSVCDYSPPQSAAPTGSPSGGATSNRRPAYFFFGNGFRND